jgi:hypothetical protein
VRRRKNDVRKRGDAGATGAGFQACEHLRCATAVNTPRREEAVFAHERGYVYFTSKTYMYIQKGEENNGSITESVKDYRMEIFIHILKIQLTILIKKAFNLVFLLVLFFDPEDGGDVYLQKRQLTFTRPHGVISKKRELFKGKAVPVFN